MANLRKILTLSGAAIGTGYALLSGADFVNGLSYAIAGSGVAPLGIAFGKFLIRVTTDMLDTSPPASCQFVRQDIATIFTVGIIDIVEAHRHELLDAPNTLVFSTLFAAGAGNLTPLVKDVIDQALAPVAERNRARQVY